VAETESLDLTAPLLDPDFYAGDPFPLYARLRRESPLAWNGTTGFWVASRHADVVAISRDTETFSSAKGIMVFEIGSEYATPPTMMHTDPPAHTRYRNLVQPGFRPSFMRALEDGVRARTVALVDRIEPGRPVDFVSDVAVPLPLQVISDLLGVPEEEWPRFFRWSEAVIPGATDWPEEGAPPKRRWWSTCWPRRRSAGQPGRGHHLGLGAAVVDGSVERRQLAMFLVSSGGGNETTRA
jgi:cytochrome P450